MVEHEFELADLKRQNLGKSIEKLKTDASEIIILVRQLKGLLNHIDKRSRELDLKEKKLQSLSLDLDTKIKTFEAEKSKDGDLTKLVEECTEELRSKRNQPTLKLDSLNKLLHSRLEAKHLNSAEKDSPSGKISSGSSDSDQPEDSGLQSVVRRSKEIAEAEISLMRQEKLPLQSQLESALKMAEPARGSLNAERASTRASLLTEDGIKSLQLQVSEMNLLRESNMQLREENKHNFEECQRLREVAQKAGMESDNLENLLKQKQTELDLCMKEMERLRMETDLQKIRVDELRETYRNIDVADYNRLKDEVRQLEEKLKAKDAHVEDFKKVLLERQNKISLLEKELTNCKKDLSEREKRFDDAQQAQATMQSELNKQKAELEKYKKAFSSLNSSKSKYEKEKEDLNKVNQSLSKQLEEAKEAGKRTTTTDAMVEQAVKEREEKEHKIQLMDKYVHSLKDEMRKKNEDLKKKDEELTKERTERKSVEKEVGDSLTKIKKEKTKVDEELAKLERYQTALSHLSEELDKLKQADGNLPEGTSAVQVLSGSILNDQAAAYVSAVEYFERVARSIAINSQVSTKPTDMVTEPSSSTPAAVEPSAIARAPSSTPLKAPVATTQQPPKVASDDKEKRLTSQKPSTENRRPSSRRIIRPQLLRPEGSPQVDVEMPEAEGAGDEGKQSAAHETESQVITSVRKRQADLLASEQQQESLTQGQTSSEIAPPAKKAKGSESLPDASEGENLGKEPAVDESMDATTAADGDNEETEAENAEEKAEESLETQQENEAEVQDKADEPVEENPIETETIPTEEESRDQTEQENQEFLTDMESDKEEGELDLANLMRSPEKGEVPPETLATPTQSPSRMETLVEEAETTIEPLLEDDKNDEGGDAAELRSL